MTQEQAQYSPTGWSITLAADAAEQAARARSRLVGTSTQPAAESDRAGVLAADAAVRAAAARMRWVAAAKPAATGAHKRVLARAAGLYRRAMRTLFEGQPRRPLGALGA